MQEKEKMQNWRNLRFEEFTHLILPFFPEGVKDHDVITRQTFLIFFLSETISIASLHVFSSLISVMSFLQDFWGLSVYSNDVPKPSQFLSWIFPFLISVFSN